ncbi:hypothetical protein ABPG75_008203 [Micractinium tetrahymenae]
MFVQKKADPAVARAELKRNVTVFLTAVLAVRALPYCLELMCGIFGYYNYRVPHSRQEILDCLLTGLRRLEYRGYDSAGVCLDLEPVPPATPDGAAANGSGGPANGSSADGAAHGPPGAPATPPPLVIKASGKIAELERKAYEELREREVDLTSVFHVHVGIAHTRWATHGPPTATNAHPQVSSPAHEFVVVHNGIITNFKALKGFLAGKGFHFVSDTDTEVIPKLCQFLYASSPTKVPLSELVMDVMGQLEGAYALLLKSTHYPREVVACKRGSPLILGLRSAPTPGSAGGAAAALARAVSGEVGAGPPAKRPAAEGFECFFASDASAVVEHTKKVIVLEDSDVVHLQGGAYTLFNAAERNAELAAAGAAGAAAGGAGRVPPVAVSRALQTLEMEVSQIMKGGYDHYMQKEIHEQPESIFQTMRGRVSRMGAGADAAAGGERCIKLGGLAEHVEAMRSGRRIMFVACGTSYHATLAARQTVEDLVSIPVACELASDLLDRRCPIFRDDTCVFVSQSGETADTLAALEYAKARGALCVGITNTVGSAIARSTHCGVHINAGCEIGVASTKAYTSQIAVITMMALALSEDSISKRDKRNAIIDGLAELPEKIRQALKLDLEMRRLAGTLEGEQSLLVFGRGYNYATALEAALKVKEVALMHSEGILAGEMKHGPLALVDDTMPILAIATKDSMHPKMLSVIQQLLARGANLLVVCNEGDDDLEELCGSPDKRCSLIRVPQVVDCLQPIVNIVPLQLLSYHLTCLRGHNVDQPRNLAKAVTVNEES